jgi:CRP/FNR family cyclic AMP-dependent transcriptional regulator
MSKRDAFFDRAFGSERPVRVLDEDPELFSSLPERARLEARARAVAPLLQLDRGPWNARVDGVQDFGDCLGLLVLDGLVLHSVVVAHEPRSELVGPGDVIRPWEYDDEDASVPFESSWEAVQPARIAVLDGRFVAVACQWPQLMPALIARATRRSRWLTLQLAVTDLRRVDDRLMLFLWHMADRWGRVRPDGVLVPLPVTHDVLAQLIGVQRPTVTSGLRRLVDAGRIRRLPNRNWLLSPVPPPAPTRRAAPAQVSGPEPT